MTKYGAWGGYDEEYSYVLYPEVDDARYFIELAEDEFADYEKTRADWMAWQERIEKDAVWQPPKPRPFVAVPVEVTPYRDDCYWHLCESDSQELYRVDGHQYCGTHAPKVVELKTIARADGNRKEWWAYTLPAESPTRLD